VTRLLRSERGFALPMALGVIMVLGILGVAAATYSLTSGSSAAQSKGSLQALQYAESGLDSAYSVLWNTNLAGSDPTVAGIIGTSDTPKIFCFIQGATCTTDGGSPGSASVYGCYGGTSGSTCNGNTVPASTWWIVSTGYGQTNDGQTTARTMSATAVIHALNTQQAVGAVWNHIFLTAPLVPNVCQTTFAANNLIINAPVYSIGNVCITGNNDEIAETTQPVDLMVGGKLILSGNNSEVGTGSSGQITSGVVVGGCNASGVANATTSCTSGSYRYYVKSPESFISQDSPTLTNAQIEADYSGDDPGPRNTCLSGTTPAALADNQLDFSVGATEGISTLPNDSGSGSSGGTFNLTPSSSYACISKNGTGVGYLIWNNGNSSLTVSGITVPAKTLAVNGSIYFDSNVSVTQSATYTGVAIIMASGSFSFASNGASLCAVSSCGTSWQGTSGNNSMLTLASLLASSSAISFSSNNNSFQGSMYTQPSAGVTFAGNNTTIQGPMSIGTMSIVSNNPSLQPLPVIKNMPVGAPLPPNIGLTIAPMTIVH